MKILILETEPLFQIGLEEKFNHSSCYCVDFIDKIEEFDSVFKKSSIEWDIFLFSLVDLESSKVEYLLRETIAADRLRLMGYVNGFTPQFHSSTIFSHFSGFIFRDAPFYSMERAFQKVAGGHKYFPEKNGVSFLEMVRSSIQIELKRKRLMQELKEKEVRIIRLSARGLSTTDIAEELSLSKRTIEGYRSRIYEKIGGKSLVDIIKVSKLLD